MNALFDQPIERRGTGCAKWSRYDEDVLPMWVADMDFAAPPPVIEALRERLEHPVLGYARPQARLFRAIQDYLADAYGWIVEREAIVFLPGVEPGFNMALKGLLAPGDGVVLENPVYAPLLAAPAHWGLRRQDVDLISAEQGWFSDIPKLEAALDDAAALLLCNPQNPTGKSYTREELERIASLCVQRDVVVIADEIHCDLVLDGRAHTPIASLGPEIASRSVTLMSASKTYNVAGMKAAFAIIPSPVVRERFQASRLGMVDSVNALGLEVALAAYTQCSEWRQKLTAYLAENRDHLATRLAREIPDIVLRPAEASFLAWLDCSALALDGSPQAFFLENARVGLSSGADFGVAYGNYVRLNYGCPRALLDEGIDRMVSSLLRR